MIIGAGMAVHNIREHFRHPNPSTPAAYTVSFDEALREAVEGSVNGRGERMADLLKRGDAKKAHPSWDHLWPIFVAAGAGGSDEGSRTWTLCEGSLSWGMFRFGEVV